MNPPPTPPPFDWEKLARAAQHAPRAGTPEAPFGLATRVLALAREQRGTESLWLSWCLRAAFAAFALALISQMVFTPARDDSLSLNSGIEAEIADLVFAP